MGFLSFLGITQAREPLAVGEKAPSVISVDQNGMPMDFNQVYQRGITLVYFYPKADTPGCTAEACSLRDGFTQLAEKGVQVVGVSTDTPDDQKKFKEKYHLPFTLIADVDKQVTKAFGVSTTLGHASRQSFLIQRGMVVWRDLKASTQAQAQDVLKALAALK